MSHGIFFITRNLYDVILSTGKGKTDKKQTINKCMYMIVWAINTTRTKPNEVNKPRE